MTTPNVMTLKVSEQSVAIIAPLQEYIGIKIRFKVTFSTAAATCMKLRER